MVRSGTIERVRLVRDEMNWLLQSQPRLMQPYSQRCWGELHPSVRLGNADRQRTHRGERAEELRKPKC